MPGAAAWAADLQPAPDLVFPQTAVPEEETSGLRLGLSAPTDGPGTPDRRRGVGLVGGMALGEDVRLTAEGALMERLDGAASDAGAGVLRGRLTYGGGVDALGLEPGRVTPWVEGAWRMPLSSGTLSEGSVALGLDVEATPSTGFSMSAKTTFTGPQEQDDVSANAGLQLKF